MLRLPTVSSPAVFDGKIILGGGMHDSPGAALFCFPADGGHLLWVLETGGAAHAHGGIADRGQRPRLHRRRGGRRPVPRPEHGHPQRQGTGPQGRAAPPGGALEDAPGQVRGGQEEGPGLRRPAERERPAPPGPEDRLDAGPEALARGRPDPGGRRQGARRVRLPGQGEGGRPGRLLAGRRNRQGTLAGPADAQPLGRADARRRYRDRHHQQHRVHDRRA